MPLARAMWIAPDLAGGYHDAQTLDDIGVLARVRAARTRHEIALRCRAHGIRTGSLQPPGVTPGRIFSPRCQRDREPSPNDRYLLV